MNSKSLVVALVAAIAVAISLSLAGLSSGQQPGTATITITVPADAKLYFDGSPTSQTGPTRTFVTPSLTAGKKYSYSIRAEVVRDGKVAAQTKVVNFQAGQTVAVDFTGIDSPGADEPDSHDPGWPRKIMGEGETILAYQPQVESWEKNLLTARAAVAVEFKASPQATYGVVWFTARTDVDREQRLVTLNDFKLTKVSFPAAPDKEAAFMAVLATKLPSGSKTVSLSRIQANLTVTQAESKVQKLPLKNEPPRIFYSTKPAVLVLVDGAPGLRPVPNSKLLRVINTRALMLLDKDTGTYYLHFVDYWLEAKAVDGTWSVAANPPPALEAVKKSLASAPDVDLLDDPAPDLKAELEKGIHPEVFVSTVPAELLEVEGVPGYTPIDGTQLLYVTNSVNQIILDTTTSDFFVLLSGRWFKSKSLQNGPWEFVPGDKLSPDFSKIPENHPAGDVLAAVAGTPQAKEAIIANDIPQTATVKRSEATLSPVYDGDPQFEPVEDTQLQYAVNSPTPVIQVAPQSYYAVENGVWFMSQSPAGPWIVADTVPADIYTIPPSSPIYYVTNVQVYGGTPDVVYVGYTPGYYGACLSPWGTVVYGTGFPYRPWLGRNWYGRCWSYGYGACLRWSTGSGWSFGFAAGIGRPWGGPIGWNAGVGGGIWRAGWAGGFGGRYAGVHTSNVNINNFNVYNRWPTNSLTVRRTAATTVGAVQRTNVEASKGLNSVYAGSNGLVYKNTTAGWQEHTNVGGWTAAQPMTPALQQLNSSIGARNVGAIQTQQFRAAGGFAGTGGVHVGGVTGFRGAAVGGIRRR